MSSRSALASPPSQRGGRSVLEAARFPRTLDLRQPQLGRRFKCGMQRPPSSGRGLGEVVVAVVEHLHSSLDLCGSPSSTTHHPIHAESPRGFPGPAVVFHHRARVAEAGSSDQL